MAQLFIEGKASYCFTTKTNEGGKYPSHMYEVGIKPEFFPAELSDFQKKDGTFKAKSKFPFLMFDERAERIDVVAIPNDTPIKVAVSIIEGERGKFLACDGIMFTSGVPEAYNPFK